MVNSVLDTLISDLLKWVVRTEHGPPLWGGCMKEKLPQSSLRDLDGPRSGLEKLKSEPQPDSAAKAAFPLERFCPQLSMAPVLAIV